MSLALMSAFRLQRFETLEMLRNSGRTSSEQVFRFLVIGDIPVQYVCTVGRVATLQFHGLGFDCMLQILSVWSFTCSSGSLPPLKNMAVCGLHAVIYS